MPDGVAVVGLRVERDGARVVDGASFDVPAGAVSGLLGPNGAGKSSILKALAGILPYEGRVRVGGRDLRALDRAARARAVAYVPQQSALRSALTVAAVVAQGRYAHHAGGAGTTVAADRRAVDRALEVTETAPFAERSFLTLSQGERQRVLIARALATQARVLLLDEPTSALDVGHALKLYGLLRRLADEGHAVLAVLHPLAEALDWTDHAVLLERGRVRAAGETRSIIREGVVESVYGVRLVKNGALGFRLPAPLPPTGSSCA